MTKLDWKDKYGEAYADATEVVESIPTGIEDIDSLTGVKGLPKGRICEIFGIFSSGKTLISLQILGNMQKQGMKCGWVDAEHCFNEEFSRKMGVDTSKLLLIKPTYGEQGLNAVEDMLEEGYNFIVIDSVAALTPKAELEGEVGDVHMARMARMMGQAMRKIIPLVAKKKAIVVFLNQVRQSLAMYGNVGDVTPGGKALPFFASVRIELKKTTRIKKGEKLVGFRIKATVVKNKVGVPFKESVFPVFFGEGFTVKDSKFKKLLKEEEENE